MNTGRYNSELQSEMTQDPEKPDKNGPKALAEDKKKKVALPDDASEREARQSAIGRELRRMFEEVVNEPVPDEMLDLLRQIDKQQSD